MLWNLTGGIDGGVHATDVTNASRTLFMDLETLSWREDILADFGVPASMLPEIRSSSEVYGTVESSSLLRETPIAGILGDQQAATFGQAFDPGESKNTYGTGNFLIFQTGEEIVHSKNGLLTTLGYKLGDQPARYALEGSIAVTGSLIQWLRDQLGIISSAPEVEKLAESVDDNGGVYFVPAFSGLFAPYWRPDARGAIVGMTRYVNRGHIARAALEATAFQSREVLDAVNADSGVDLAELKVDGGMTANDALMQFQATSSAYPWCARSSPRPPPWVPRTPRASRSASGTTSTTCAPTGRKTSAGSPTWTTASASASCACGRRPSPSRWTGSTTTCADPAPHERTPVGLAPAGCVVRGAHRSRGTGSRHPDAENSALRLGVRRPTASD